MQRQFSLYEFRKIWSVVKIGEGPCISNESSQERACGYLGELLSYIEVSKGSCIGNRVCEGKQYNYNGHLNQSECRNRHIIVGDNCCHEYWSCIFVKRKPR